MSAVTGIEWTDRTWNPVTGCTKVSPGCAHCYAKTIAKRLWPTTYPHIPQGQSGNIMVSRPREFEDVQVHEDRLLEPLSWRKPSRVFVNSMSDLFHEDVPDAFIDRVFSVMGLAERHTFQILTKRADRMRQYMTSRPASPTVPGEVNIATETGLGVYHVRWPLPNVWLGVSVENQHFADERIPLLLQTPAAVRFISAEPLLGPVNLNRHMAKPMFYCSGCGVEKFRPYCSPCGRDLETVTNEIAGLDWVIVGGESGPGARPFDLAWARSIVQQCKAAGVACFMKQLGSNPQCGTCLDGSICWCSDGLGAITDRKGGEMQEWPEDLRVREFPGVRA